MERLQFTVEKLIILNYGRNPKDTVDPRLLTMHQLFDGHL